MKPLEVGTSQRAENLKKKSSKILRSNNGIGGAPTNYRRRRRRRRADQQKSAAAALTNCRRRRRGAAGARLYCVVYIVCKRRVRASILLLLDGYNNYRDLEQVLRAIELSAVLLRLRLRGVYTSELCHVQPFPPPT